MYPCQESFLNINYITEHDILFMCPYSNGVALVNNDTGSETSSIASKARTKVAEWCKACIICEELRNDNAAIETINKCRNDVCTTLCHNGLFNPKYSKYIGESINQYMFATNQIKQNKEIIND